MKLALATSLLALPSANHLAAASVARKMEGDDVTITDNTNENDIVVRNPTCDCQPMPPKDPSYQVTRLWNIVDPSSMTDQDVIDEFNSGFAPFVTNMPGFQRYMASSTGNTSTVFFLNQFYTQEEAHAAQEAAKEFVAKGALNGKITPNIFTGAQGFFAEPSDTCIDSSSTGDYLGVRFYEFADPASVNSTELFSAITRYYGEHLKDAEGFVTYYKAVHTGGDIAWNIFKTEEQAIESNEAAANDPLDDFPDMDRVGSAAGIIKFDYTCAAGNKPAAPTPPPSPCVPSAVNACVEEVPNDDSNPTGPPSAAFSTSFSVASAVAAAVFMMFWKAII